MYPKLFIENFWRPEEKDEIFACMPFDDGGKFDTRFENIIIKAAEKLGYKKDKIIRADFRKGNESTYEIWNGIASAKILLFDLSNDPRYNKPNINVAYELGVATSIRDLSEMLLIRERPLNMEEFPSNIKDLPLEPYFDKELTVEWMEERLGAVLERKNWQKNKLLEITKNSMEPVGFILMDRYYQESQIFDRNLSDRERSAALRLIDLGVLKGLPAVRGEESERLEYSYCWTRFGQEFKKYLELDKRPRR